MDSCRVPQTGRLRRRSQDRDTTGHSPEFSLIFNRFQSGRDDDAASRRLGIGLAIVKQLVELAEKSTSPARELGKGLFTVRFPFRQPIAQTMAAAKSAVTTREKPAVAKYLPRRRGFSWTTRSMREL
jgi:hypothetical protein